MPKFLDRLTLLEADCLGRMEAAQAAVERIFRLMEKPGTAYGVLCRASGDARVLGYYQAYSRGSTHRRITGGPQLAGRNPVYVAVELFYPGLLRSLLSDVYSVVEEALGVKPSSGYFVGSGVEGVIGVTKLGEVGVIELVASGGDGVEEALKHVLEEGFRHVKTKTGRLEPEDYKNGVGYKSSTWLRYTGASGSSIRVQVSSSQGHTLAIGVNLQGVYIVDARIEGDFYAAPPGEPFSLMAQMEGTQVNELMAYQIQLAFRDRVDLAGVEYRHLEEAIGEVYRRAGEWVYSS